MKYAAFNKDGLPEAFYDSEINTIPDGAVEISETQHQEFLQNQGRKKWDGEKVVDYTPPPPSKSVFKGQLGTYREQHIEQSTVVLANGAELANDEQTRSRVSQTIGYLENTNATQVTWSAVNGPHVLELTDLQEAVQKGGQAMQAAFDAYATTLGEIEDGTLTTIDGVKQRFDELMGQ